MTLGDQQYSSTKVQVIFSTLMARWSLTLNLCKLYPRYLDIVLWLSSHYPGQCSIPPQISGVIKWCTGPYSSSAEDTANYDVGWNPLPNATDNATQVFFSVSIKINRVTWVVSVFLALSLEWVSLSSVFWVNLSYASVRRLSSVSWVSVSSVSRVSKSELCLLNES